MHTEFHFSVRNQKWSLRS